MQLNTDARRCGLEPLLQFLGRDIIIGHTRLKRQIVTVAASYLMRLSFRGPSVLVDNGAGVFRVVGQNDSTRTRGWHCSPRVSCPERKPTSAISRVANARYPRARGIAVPTARACSIMFNQPSATCQCGHTKCAAGE